MGKHLRTCTHQVHDCFANPDVLLLAAELQYYRVPHDDWALMLARMRHMGANTISTYVMWGWHEPEEGAIDLTGTTHPARDLVDFVHLVHEMGFRLILKPGPFIDAEVLGGGIPSWLLAQHPEIWALRHDGHPWRHSDSNQPRCSYMHPTYLACVKRWYNAVTDAVLPFQWPQGPIIALQVDNETPGDGMIAGDTEGQDFDYHFRGDYNPYVIDTLWPRWLAQQYGRISDLNSAYGCAFAGFDDIPYPAIWRDPSTIGALRAWLDIARFTDWTLSEGLRTYADILRGQGWRVPLFQDLLAMPWEASGLLVDMKGFADATGWLAHNVYAENVRDPFVTYGWYRLSFEEYVHYAIWRTRLMKSYTPHFPSFIPEISAVGDFYVQAPFAGGLEAVSIYVGPQSPTEPSSIGAFPRWAMEAPVRVDGTIRPRLWNAKTILTLLTAGGPDLARASQPADVALGYSHIPEAAAQWSFAPAGDNKRLGQVSPLTGGSNSAERSQCIAQQLVRQHIDFAVLDIDATTSEILAEHRLLVLPASIMLARDTQVRLADYLRNDGEICWADGDLPAYDEKMNLCDLLARAAQETGNLIRVPTLDADWLALISEAGLHAHYAWGNAEHVDVTVRYGDNGLIFLALANRSPVTFDGPVTYLDANGEPHTVRIRAGGPHVSFALLRGERLEAALLHGEDGAFIACPQGRMAIDRGQVVIAQFGEMMLISSAESARVTLLRHEGWDGVLTWRLLLDGAIVEATSIVNDETLTLNYRAETSARETEAYMLAPHNAELTPRLRPLLTTRLIQAAHYLEAASRIHTCTQPEIGAAQAALTPLAKALREAAEGTLNLDTYIAARGIAAMALHEPGSVLVDVLRGLRGELSVGENSPEKTRAECAMTQILHLLARSELWH